MHGMLMHTQENVLMGGKPIIKKNENSVYIPNLKGGLNPNENTGNSGYLACCRMERLNKPTY